MRTTKSYKICFRELWNYYFSLYKIYICNNENNLLWLLNSSTQSSCDTIYIYNQQKNLCDLHVHTMAEYSNQVHRKLSCIYVLKHLNSTPFWFRVVQANFIVCFIMDGYLHVSVSCRCLLFFLNCARKLHVM